MRVLHTSDWHLGKPLEGRDRLEEQGKVLDEMVELAEAENVHLVLLAGDIFDTFNPPAAAEDLFYDAIDRLAAGGRRAVVIIAGNHDQPSRLTASQPLAGRQGISILGLPEDILPPGGKAGGVQCIRSARSLVELAIPGCDHTTVIAALPYPSEARLNQVLSESTREDLLQQAYAARVRSVLTELSAFYRPDAVNLAMSHLFVSGSQESGVESGERQIQVGGAYSVTAADFPETAQYVALGHLHRPQSVGGQERVRYSGSPLAYSFSETHTKSVVLLDVEPGKPADIRQIQLSAGRPLVVWKAREGMAQALAWCDEGRDAEAWISLEVHSDRPLEPLDISELRKRRERILPIKFVPTGMVQVDTPEKRSSLSQEELFRQFYRSRRKGDPSDALVQLFLELSQTTDPES